MVTRVVAMDALIEAAKQKKGKQFIFLSPLPVHETDESVTIFKMPDPDRIHR